MTGFEAAAAQIDGVMGRAYFHAVGQLAYSPLSDHGGRRTISASAKNAQVMREQILGDTDMPVDLHFFGNGEYFHNREARGMPVLQVSWRKQSPSEVIS